MTQTAPRPARPVIGFISFAFGALALLIVLVQFSAGPFAPRQSNSVSIGEFAAEVREAAKRKLTGQSAPAPVAAPMDIDKILNIAAMVLAGIAIIGGAIAVLLKEPSAPGIAAISFGGSAVLMQFVIWLALLVAGVILMGYVLKNMDGILGD